uniref:Uncharacterized protein n=1 Tax=Trypanosoma brucei brucei (strain 927/4 GUTat10.1) TaxID=185431 RepID=Q4FKM0_TRYB2|nr:hypothetical protein Tb10.v4.0128 [Trypanosoma brucei brucei TREU927]
MYINALYTSVSSSCLFTLKTKKKHIRNEYYLESPLLLSGGLCPPLSAPSTFIFTRSVLNALNKKQKQRKNFITYKIYVMMRRCERYYIMFASTMRMHIHSMCVYVFVCIVARHTVWHNIYMRQFPIIFGALCCYMCVSATNSVNQTYLSVYIYIYISMQYNYILSLSKREYMHGLARAAPSTTWGSRGTLRPEALNFDAWNFVLRDF